MTEEELRQRLERTRQRYERQEIRLDALLQSMQNNRDKMEQIEYALAMMERAGTQRLHPRIVHYAEIRNFIAYASRLYDRLQSRLHRHLNYAYFCSVICSRYLFESRFHIRDRHFLNFTTILSYFKQERGR